MAGIPRRGEDWLSILRRLHGVLKRVPDHYTGGILGSMTTPPHPLGSLVFQLFHLYNINDLELFAELRELEEEAVSMMGEIMGCEGCTGMVTSGGSEANLAALYLAREHGYDTVYVAPTAHDSVFKAARLLRMKLVEVGLDGEYRMSARILEEKMEANGPGMVVVTLGTTGLGLLDPVEKIASIASRQGGVVHVDAALGGFVAPFLYPERRLGFQNPVVVSVTMDPHKLGLAPIPAGGLVVRSEEWFSPLVFKSSYMPAGIQIGLLGTRTAASAVATWAVMRHVGMEGYRRQARRLMGLARRFIRLAESRGLKVAAEPEVPVVCLETGDADEVLKRLASRGLLLYRCGVVEGVRVVVMPHVTYGHLKRVVEVLTRLQG